MDERSSSDNVFKKGGKADPGNCRGISLLSSVGSTFREILNDRMGTLMMEKKDKKAKSKQG